MMNIKAVDTNVLARILIDDSDSAAQINAARQFARQHHRLFVPQIVQVELVWICEFSYALDKAEIIKILQHLDENEVFVLQHADQFKKALLYFQNSNADFSDCLILAASSEAGYEVVTFDKKYSKLKGVHLLT